MRIVAVFSFSLVAGSLGGFAAGQSLGCSADSLAALNATLSGRLQRTTPLASVCFSQPDGTRCASLKQDLESGLYRTNTYEGFQNIQGEACAADPSNQCLLEPGTLSTPNNTSCKQGVLSTYFVEVNGASDVQAVFDYARQSPIVLSIKNSGHDYVMRSSRSGNCSLALWTRKLREMTYRDSFTPEGCTADTQAPLPALTFGAGVNTDEAIRFAHGKGAVFAAGNSVTLGASGGWLLNGGHSSLSVGLGLAADRVLQFTIVTPDGRLRIANKCTNPDLFWALRGGGGGSFGVVLDATHLAEPDMPITSAMLSFTPTNSNQAPFVSLLAENFREWALEGWGGPSGGSFSFLANPFLSASQARTMLAPAIDYVERQRGVAIIQTYPSFFDYYSDKINGTLSAPETPSTAMVTSSRTIHEDVFLNTTARDQLVTAIMDTQNDGLTTMFLSDTPIRYGRSNPDPQTSLHPAWYNSVWHVVTYAGWESTTPLQGRKAAAATLRKATARWSAVGTDGCTYANEADPWLDDWATQIWGENYGRLLEVKKAVDPDSLLTCWHCVGWNDTMTGYECMSSLAAK